jgi:hypothetical protein
MSDIHSGYRVNPVALLLINAACCSCTFEQLSRWMRHVTPQFLPTGTVSETEQAGSGENKTCSNTPLCISSTYRSCCLFYGTKAPISSSLYRHRQIQSHVRLCLTSASSRSNCFFLPCVLIIPFRTNSVSKNVALVIASCLLRPVQGMKILLQDVSESGM